MRDRRWEIRGRIEDDRELRVAVQLRRQVRSQVQLGNEQSAGSYAVKLDPS